MAHHAVLDAVGKTPLDEWSARHRDLYLTTHNNQETDIHEPGGIRTQNPSKQEAAHPHLRPRDVWDQLIKQLRKGKFLSAGIRTMGSSKKPHLSVVDRRNIAYVFIAHVLKCFNSAAMTSVYGSHEDLLCTS